MFESSETLYDGTIVDGSDNIVAWAAANVA
jgi:hypothetical protein